MDALGFTDTIAAISTPLGEGGLAVLRISGQEALAIGDRTFRPVNKAGVGHLQSAQSHTVHYGHIYDDAGQRVDEVLVTVLRTPRSYTREDTVEISCHGGLISVRRVMEVVLAAGARLAEPGEFTKRAFLNGRIDLAQAEAVIDVIRSKTETGQKVALEALQGSLSTEVKYLKGKLTEILMYLEASIDFPEDEIPPLEADLAETLAHIEQELARLIATARTGRIYREGLSVVIAGKPNVGKSSLLNALVDEDRAIVTDIPGTTRDLLEEYLNLGGLPLRVIDTAGIRQTTEEVEKIGVERTKGAIDRADLLLFLIDSSVSLSTEDLEVAARLPEEKTILVANKVDKGSGADLSQLIRRFGVPVAISATHHQGLSALKEAVISKAALIDVDTASTALVTNLRHLDALRRASQAVESARESYQTGLAEDFVTIDLHSAVESLGEITGDTASDDLVNQIFASFCIGK